MIPATSGKIESGKNDPVELARLLDIELIQKRAEWQRASRRYRAVKTLSLLFLFLVIAGVILAVFFGLSFLPHASALPGR
jgi:hypothetical protein